MGGVVQGWLGCSKARGSEGCGLGPGLRDQVPPTAKAHTTQCVTLTAQVH